MHADLSIGGMALRVVAVYGPTEKANDTEKDKFWRSLRKSCAIEKRRQLLLLSDFNATTTVIKCQATYFRGQFIDNMQNNDNGQRLIRFCAEVQTPIVNTYFRHKPANSYTWYSNDQHTRKIIDLTISNQFLQRFCLDCRVRSSYDFHSDHRILITRFKTPKHRTMMKKSKYTKSKSKKIDFTNFTEEQIRTYKNVLSENLKKGINEISAEQLIQILQRSAEETLPRVNKTRHQPHPWDEDPQLKELLDTRENFHIRYDRRQYRNIQRKIRKRVTALRNEHFMNEARRFSNAKTNRKIAESYKIAKDQAKIYRKKPRQTACPGLLEHFQNHFNPDHSSKHEPTTLPQLREPPIPHINDSPPTKEEVLKAIRQLRKPRHSSRTCKNEH